MCNEVWLYNCFCPRDCMSCFNLYWWRWQILPSKAWPYINLILFGWWLKNFFSIIIINKNSRQDPTLEPIPTLQCSAAGNIGFIIRHPLNFCREITRPVGFRNPLEFQDRYGIQSMWNGLFLINKWNPISYANFNRFLLPLQLQKPLQKLKKTSNATGENFPERWRTY